MKILKLAVYLLAIALSSQLFLVTTASVATPQTDIPATATSAEVLSDPNAEYVSVEEAKEIYDFAPSFSVAWRGTVDTDLTNFADPLGKDYGPAKNLACSPA